MFLKTSKGGEHLETRSRAGGGYRNPTGGALIIQPKDPQKRGKVGWRPPERESKRKRETNKPLHESRKKVTKKKGTIRKNEKNTKYRGKK